MTEHRYISTACIHGEHDYCNATTGQAGTKTPAVCKFCSAPCECPEPMCHPNKPERAICHHCQAVDVVITTIRHGDPEYSAEKGWRRVRAHPCGHEWWTRRVEDA